MIVAFCVGCMIVFSPRSSAPRCPRCHRYDVVRVLDAEARRALTGPDVRAITTLTIIERPRKEGLWR